MHLQPSFSHSDLQKKRQWPQHIHHSDSLANANADNIWVMDSGVASHVTYDPSQFIEFEPLHIVAIKCPYY